MMARYRLTAPIQAIGHAPEGAEIADRRVRLPAGAVLIESIQRNGTLKGMIGVYWEGRHYSVFLRDLLQNPVHIAANRRCRPDSRTPNPKATVSAGPIHWTPKFSV
jgi:hypothetical protein